MPLRTRTFDCGVCPTVDSVSLPPSAQIADYRREIVARGWFVCGEGKNKRNRCPECLRAKSHGPHCNLCRTDPLTLGSDAERDTFRPMVRTLPRVQGRAPRNLEPLEILICGVCWESLRVNFLDGVRYELEAFRKVAEIFEG